MLKHENLNNMENLVSQFQIEGHFKSAAPYGEGHINKTFLVETCCNKYILQRVNNVVFPNIEDLMSNIEKVTSFISSKGKETIKLIPTKKGKSYFKTEDSFYRMMEFAENTITYQKPVSLDLVASQGEAFGELHLLLSDLPVKGIKEVIPNFHNTRQRYLNFVNALENAPKDKIEIAKEEIAFIKEHEKDYSLVINEIEKGNIKTRVTHNDTKINNILFDKDTGKYRLIIDLDTIMPGSILYDIGDAFRGLFTGENEDNKDTSLLKVNLDIFKAFTYAYLSKMQNDLTETEKKLIPFSAYLLTIECGIRFLEDYLRGNVYFHVDYEEHNLVRARTQIALAKDILKNLKTLEQITEDYKG